MVVSTLQTGKRPGPDGSLSFLLLGYYSMKSSTLAAFLKLAPSTALLLFKEERSCASSRSISLLNMDFKILS